MSTHVIDPSSGPSAPKFITGNEKKIQMETILSDLNTVFFFGKIFGKMNKDDSGAEAREQKNTKQHKKWSIFPSIFFLLVTQKEYWIAHPQFLSSCPRHENSQQSLALNHYQSEILDFDFELNSAVLTLTRETRKTQLQLRMFRLFSISSHRVLVSTMTI